MTKSSRLLARVLAGAEIVVRRAHPRPAGDPRTPGRLKGQTELGADFDATPRGFAEYVA
jgi:hypothetical protein